MKKEFFLFLTALLPVVALSNEPSAFGNSDINSAPSTYSNTVTVSEKKYFPNNQKVTSSSSSDNIGSVKVELSNVAEQYEGVRSVLDSYETKIAKQDEKIRQLEEDMRKLREYVEENRQIQADNQEKIKVVVGELGSLIDSINKDYVPKDKFDHLFNEVQALKNTSSKSSPSKASSQKEDNKEKTISAKELSSKDSATLIQEAEDYLTKKSYNEAQTIYNELLNRNYKPARVNFNLGEIAYSQKAYSKAIEHYKTSISLFDKASYIPTLLYHTGTSFEKLGKAKESQGFYKALKSNYPDSPEAKKVK